MTVYLDQRNIHFDLFIDHGIAQWNAPTAARSCQWQPTANIVAWSNYGVLIYVVCATYILAKARYLKNFRNRCE